MTLENRKAPRARISFPLKCEIGEKTSYFNSVSKDLSNGGVRVLSEQFVTPGDTINVNINLIEKMISARAKIVWCNESDYGQRYLFGAEFVDMTEDDKNTLRSFLSLIFPS